MNPNQLLEARESGRLRVRTLNTEASKTLQSQKDDADIRKILGRYERTGVLVNMRDVDLTFRDVSEFSDFSDLMRQSKEAEAAFMRLPSKVREIFKHDVNRWLDAAHDTSKLEALRPDLERLGILEEVAEPPKADPPAEPSSE